MPQKPKDENLLPTGIAGLDSILGGGMSRNHSILLCGPPGSGKTTLAFQILYYGAKSADAPGAYISFDEDEDKLRSNVMQFGWDLQKLEDQNLLHLQKVGALEIQQFASQESILFIEIIRSINAKQVIVDSLTTYELLFKQDYERMVYVRRLIEGILNQGCTFIATSESTPGHLTRFQISEFIFDTVIHLDINPEVSANRTIEIVKSRGKPHRIGKHPMAITQGGIEVYPKK